MAEGFTLNLTIIYIYAHAFNTMHVLMCACAYNDMSRDDR